MKHFGQFEFVKVKDDMDFNLTTINSHHLGHGFPMKRAPSVDQFYSWSWGRGDTYGDVDFMNIQ